MSATLIGLVVYMVAMLGVGAWTWRRNETKEDFILGGRRLGPWVIAFSERTAAESAWLVLGLSGAVYATGLVEIWTVIGCVTGIVASWFVIARRLRVASAELGAITLPEYLVRFAGTGATAVRVLSMLILGAFFAIYLAAQFVGAGKVLATTFGIRPAIGIPFAAAVVVAYTLMGGFLAVCYTDVVQALIMVIALVILPIVGLVYLSSHGLGVGEALDAAPAVASWTGGHTGWAAASAVIGGLSWGLGYLGQPHLVTKFMAIDRPEAVRTGRNVAIVWTVLAYAGATATGLVGLALAHHGLLGGAGLTGGAADPERIMPVLAGFLLPAWLTGILVSGAIAAMMSTADSQLLITTSTVVEDFTCKTLRRPLTDRQLVAMSRLVTLGVGAIAYVVAATNQHLIYRMVSYAWSGLGASFGPAIVLSLHWRRMNGPGVLASLVVGSLGTVLWVEVPALASLVSVRFAAFALSTIAAVAVALATPPRARGAAGPAVPAPAPAPPIPPA